jgi:uncharacterized membrane protein YgaE (UPF0421/DUF939 family)
MSRLTELVERPAGRGPLRPMSLPERWALLRQRRALLLQLSFGAGLAWLAATQVVGHVQPFFAPIAAVIVIAAGIGQRSPVVLELVFGVAIGILVGEVIVTAIGRGVWQVTVVTALAVAVSSLLGLKGVALLQSTTSAILLVVIVPLGSHDNPAVARFLDALVGGVVGLVMIALVPVNPVRLLDREIQRVLRGLAEVLDLCANALHVRDAGVAWTALQQARALQPTIQGLADASAFASEVSRIAPLRWSQRDHVRVYANTVFDLDNAVRDGRVLARRIGAMLRHAETPPIGIEEAIVTLAAAVRIFSDDLQDNYRFDEAQRQLIEAAGIATRALPQAASMNTSSVVAQVRSLASDLLYASGSTVAEVDTWLDFDP